MPKVGRPPKDRTPAIEDLPKEFRLALIKVMAEYGIADIKEGFRQAAILLNINSPIYKKDVEKRSEMKYRSRHFTEMNKTRKTWRENDLNEGIAIGRREGEKKYRIQYYCKVCGGLLDVLPNSNEHKAIINYLRESGWAHSSCHSTPVRRLS